MGFLFSSSHLPETRVRHREKEEDEGVRPLPRGGRVRAFSHLPPQAGAQRAGRTQEPAGMGKLLIDDASPLFVRRVRQALRAEAGESPAAAALLRHVAALPNKITVKRRSTGLACTRTDQDGNVTLYLNPHAMTGATISHELGHVLQQAHTHGALRKLRAQGRRPTQADVEAAIDAGREALHAVVRVKDERDPGPEHKENEAMRISNIVNAERTATGMLKLPAARRTGAEFWARQRPRQSRDQHQDNEHPLPPGSHYGAHPLTHVRRILGCSANAAQAGGEETALIPHSSRIELASTIHGPSISTMNPHSKRRPLLFTPRSPWGGRLESHSFRSHMRASENRGTVPTPKPGESFRLARPQRKENASAREGGVVGSPPAAQAGFDPNARLYRVTGDPKTGIGTATPINPKDINPKNAQIWINGMNNDVQAATRLGLDHTGKSEFYMIHNPTNGFASDSVEATAQKMGLRTQVANSTRDLLRHFDLPTANVTSHSQGTMILNSALEDLHKEGKNMKGINLNHHGAAANSLLTAVLAHRIGANKPKFEGHPLDAVHNIIGMNTLNPLRIAGSLLASPLLFNSDPDKSPHSKRNGHAGKLSKIFQSKLFNSLNPTQ